MSKHPIIHFYYEVPLKVGDTALAPIQQHKTQKKRRGAADKTHPILSYPILELGVGDSLSIGGLTTPSSISLFQYMM